MQARPDTPTPFDERRDWGWRRTFLTGLLLWIASVVVTDFTENVHMLPTVVLLGSFLVPATAIDWFLDHDQSEIATTARVTRAFILGGGVGVVAAAVLEALLPPADVLAFVGAGVVEEAAKLIGLVLVARRLARYTVHDGIVLGAAVGFGFAALESSGYALSALLVRDGGTMVFSLGGLVSVEVARGFLAPFGHGLWTGIVGGALFAASRPGRLRMSRTVVGAYLVVALLHTGWDAMGLIATALATVYPAILTGGDSWLAALVPPTAVHALVFFGSYLAGLMILSLIGMALLHRQWRAGARDPYSTRTTREGAHPEPPPARPSADPRPVGEDRLARRT